MERERSGVRQAETPSSGPDPAQLPRLIGAARATTGLDRFVLAGKINALLIAMRAPGNEAAEAKAILEELDVSALDGLVDGEGRDCRKEAVETLLACGFPHALQVAPEDLQHARKAARHQAQKEEDEDLELVRIPEHQYRTGAWLSMGAAAGQIVGAFYVAGYAPIEAGISGVSAAIVAVGAWMLMGARKRETVWIPFTVMTAGCIASALTAFSAHHAALAVTTILCGALVMPSKGYTKSID